MTHAMIGIDFGTSNTAAARLVGGKPRLIGLEAGKDTIPTAIYLDADSRRMVCGHGAIAAMIEGRDGRFMRALKSILGTPLAREKRRLMGESLTLLDIVARFLAEVRQRAEADVGGPVTGVVAGRPVHFHSAYPTRDRQAAEDLADCYDRAGFSHVRFLPEPEAAARAVGPGTGLGLIVDIGGGTSDFTLFRSRGPGIEVQASHGVRVGGTDFDKALSLAQVMPLFGQGSELRNELGPGRHRMPAAIYQDLAAWEKIAFVYGPERLREVKRMARQAVQPKRLARLVTVLEHELGHDVAFAVEAAKIAANGPDGQGLIRLDPVEAGLRPQVWSNDLLTIFWPLADRIATAARDIVDQAGLVPADVDRVIFVGGSSLLGIIGQLMRALFPNAAFETSNVFTAVVDGLAIAAGEACP